MRRSSEREKITAAKTATPKTAQLPGTRRSPVFRQSPSNWSRPPHPTPASPRTSPAPSGSIRVDYATILEATEEHIALQGAAVTLNDKAMKIHLPRVVGSFVSSASGAATFYGTKVTAAKDLTMKSQKRIGTRTAAVSPATRTRPSAPVSLPPMGLHAYALMGAPEGAVFAYAHITGEDWKALRGTRRADHPAAPWPPAGRTGGAA
jgi:hypothetical protein